MQLASQLATLIALAVLIIATHSPMILAIELFPVPGAIRVAPPPSARVKDCTAGIIDTVVGIGESGYSGDGGPAILARLKEPRGVYLTADGTLYIADRSDHRIRKVSADAVISTVAGSGWTNPDGTGRFGGDNGLAVHAHLDRPQGVAVGVDGSFYIADTWNHRIRKVDPGGVITTLAGGGVPRDGIGDGGRAIGAILSVVEGPAALPDGTLYITEWWGHRVRKIDPVGVITTVAGNGTPGYSGDGGPATQAEVNGPHGVAVGPDGSLYFAEWHNHIIRKVDPAGIIHTVAGIGDKGYSGDGGPATEARLNTPGGLVVAADGSIYIADTYNHAIRRVSPAGIIATVAGTGTAGFSGDGGLATGASLYEPYDIALGPDGDLYIADTKNHRVRRVRLRPCEPTAAKAKADGLQAKAGGSARLWREVAELYLIAKAWDDALAAAQRVLAITAEANGPARMRAEVLIARVYAAKRDDHEARKRLIRILARAKDPVVLREAADALVELYLVRKEREQAIATLNDLRLRTENRDLLNWIDRRLKEIAGE